MQWFEYLIIAACVIFVGLVSFLHFYLKKKGKSLTSDCGGNCSACHGNCSACSHTCDKNKMLEEYHKANQN